MKKCALLAAALLCFALTASASAAPAAMEQPRPVTLADIFSPASGPLAPVALSGCYISKECACGGGYVTIECSGDVCSSGPRYVECDGYREYCPPIGSCPP